MTGAVDHVSGARATTRASRSATAQHERAPQRAAAAVPATALSTLRRPIERRPGRLAPVVLTLGLVVLGLLAVGAPARTATTSAHTRVLADVGADWDEFVRQVGSTDPARRGHPTDDALAAAPAGMAVLDRIAQHGTAADAAQARTAAATYVAYADAARQATRARDRGDRRAASQATEQAARFSAALRAQGVAHAAEKRAELDRSLGDLERTSRTTALVTVLDAVLLAGCALVRVGRRRRVVRQADAGAFPALHDPVTGLPNRADLLDRLAAALAADPRQEGGRVVVLLLDLDGFRDVNDGLGPALGDALLATTARRIYQLAANATTTVARLGDDEFAVLLDHSSPTAALLLAERLRDEVRRPVELGGLTTRTGCSIGVAVHPDHGATTTALLASADRALRDAKRRRAGVALFAAEAGDHAADRLVLLGDLSRATASAHELVLHYQPKVHAEQGVVCGVEALVRWRHPTRGLLRPAAFLGAAEASDLIIPLTDRVLEIACAQLAHWLADGLPLPVAINVSVAALTDRGLPQRLADLLAHHALPPELVTLEITETALAADQGRARETLTRLRELGLALSLDDFGTGYSSLSHLTMPLHELKIDRQFVTDMTTSPRSHAITRAVVDVAHDLGLRVVGEGVEDAATLEALRRIGCDEAQGYQVCPPVPEDQLRAWLRDRVVADAAARR